MDAKKEISASYGMDPAKERAERVVINGTDRMIQCGEMTEVHFQISISRSELIKLVRRAHGNRTARIVNGPITVDVTQFRHS
jgi:hypothetical protein